MKLRFKTHIETLLLIPVVLFFLIGIASAYAHTNAEIGGAATNAEYLRSSSIDIALFSGALIALLVLLSVFKREQSERYKKIVFSLLVLAILLPTLYFIGGTVYVNISSYTNGPIHWHADFRIIACGQELMPPEPPHRLSNKVGTPVLHEHVDRRIHVEGVVTELQEVSLGEFFRVTGGALTQDVFVVPTNEGNKTYLNPGNCPDGSAAEWNVFVYQTDPNTMIATQQKLDHPDDYVLSFHEAVPPGDCLIFEYGSKKDYTDTICNFYQVKADKGELEIRVPAKEGASEQQTENGEQLDTSNWKIYRNEEYGFEFRYPEEISVLSTLKNRFGTFSKAENKTGFTIGDVGLIVTNDEQLWSQIKKQTDFFLGIENDPPICDGPCISCKSSKQGILEKISCAGEGGGVTQWTLETHRANFYFDNDIYSSYTGILKSKEIDLLFESFKTF